MINLFLRYYHITHLENLSSIKSKGILSLDQIRRIGLRYTDISDQGAQRWRDRAEPIYGRSIHEYVPLYINPRNPMMYLRRSWHRDMIIIKVSPSCISAKDHLFADGNAASGATLFSSERSVLEKSIPILRSNAWNDFPDGKRRMCAEVLVYERVPPMYFEGAICSNEETACAMKKVINLASEINSEMFFN